jgi:hypothetical protein
MGMSNYYPSSVLTQPGVCTSTTRPASPFQGQSIYETDTDRVLVWNNFAWVSPNSKTANPAGLELVTNCTATFAGGTAGSVSNGVVTIGSANTSVTVANAFSASYDNYKIVISGGTSSANGLLRILLSGITTGYYASTAGANYSNGAYASIFQNNASLWNAVGNHYLNESVMNVFLFSPFLTKKKWITAHHVTFNSFNSYGQTVGECTGTTSVTGFQISPTSGSLTGSTIRVYGYRN